MANEDHRCEECHVGFDDARDLAGHIEALHAHSCSHCSRMFSSLHGLTVHVGRSHPSEPRPVGGLPPAPVRVASPPETPVVFGPWMGSVRVGPVDVLVTVDAHLDAADPAVLRLTAMAEISQAGAR